MRQSRIWKRRPSGLANEVKDQARNWLEPMLACRTQSAGAQVKMLKAGLKRRKD
jgi:hypothetical protein